MLLLHHPLHLLQLAWIALPLPPKLATHWTRGHIPVAGLAAMDIWKGEVDTQVIIMVVMVATMVDSEVLKEEKDKGIVW